MGQLTVHGCSVQYNHVPNETVHDVFQAVRNQILDQGFVITSVQANDMQLEFGDGNAIWEQPFQPDEVRLTIQTGRSIDLTKPVLEKFQHVLTAIAKEHESIAELFRSEKVQEASKAATEIIPFWKQLQEAIADVFVLHQVDFDQDCWKTLSETITPEVATLNDRLTQLRDALNSGDFTLVADLMEFEMAPIAERWIDVCGTIADELEKHQPNG